MLIILGVFLSVVVVAAAESVGPPLVAEFKNVLPVVVGDDDVVVVGLVNDCKWACDDE